MPEKTARQLDAEIERTRKEIVDLHERIRRMAIKRLPEQSKLRKAHPRILAIDAQLADARDVVRTHPHKAKGLNEKIDTLETERYRLLLELEET